MAAKRLAQRHPKNGSRINIALILCDSGDRYADTLFDPIWRNKQGLE